MPSRLPPRGIVLAGLMVLALAPSAHGTKGGVPTYPKTSTYVFRVPQFTEAQMESLSWFDLVTCNESPEVIAEMRARNPHQRILYRTLPQNLIDWGEHDPSWFPDTSFCLQRLCQFYAKQNDWYLYDIYGQRIEEWGGYAANWTRYCPRGTYGTSRGMTYAEWYVDVALPQIAYHSPAWERWGWGSSAYDGLAWEVMASCPACCIEDLFKYADPDRDGQAEGIDGTCWTGGVEDSLTILMRETNNDFYVRLLQVIDSDLVININRGGQGVNPDWAWELNGLKLEDWKPDWSKPAKTWWSWMYGRRSPTEFIGDGYQFAERYMHPSGIDNREGWDLTWIFIWTRGQNWPAAYAERMKRWGLGTTMLGDGYFTFTKDQHYPLWSDMYDWDFGSALEEYQRELDGADTLYVRRFAKGFVEVNPYHTRSLGGVPPEDARFAFWLTLDDLAVHEVADDHVTLTWIVPQGTTNTVDQTEIRFALTPLNPNNWGSATPAPAGPAVGTPGERLYYEVTGLRNGTRYYFAARNVVFGRGEPGISNVVSATTEGIPGGGDDLTPPAAVGDLRATDLGETWAALAWTATGDDGHSGRADHYLLRYLAGEPIESSSDWARAIPVTDGLPVPGLPGSSETFRLEGLPPGAAYGVAVRVVDDVDLVSALSNPLLIQTDAPPDTLPPNAIRDLRIEAIHPDGFLFFWTAPGDDGGVGTATDYILGYRAGAPINNEAGWAQAVHVADGLPAPAPAGTQQAFQLTGLRPLVQYGLTLRARDECGNLSPIGASWFVSTAPDPLVDTQPPAAIEDLTVVEVGEDRATFTWGSPGDDGLQGRADHFVLAWLEGTQLDSEGEWSAADTLLDGLPQPGDPGESVTYTLVGLAPGHTYSAAVRAYDDAGLRSALGASATFTTVVPDVTPPAAIDDLTSPTQGTDFVDLAWTATGDDGGSGRADHYLLRYMIGRALESESDWDSAHAVATGLPGPLPAGETQTLRLSGLESGTAYGVALRAVDEAGNVAGLSNALVVSTTVPPDVEGPDAIDDLRVTAALPDGFDLAWTATGDDGSVGSAAVYVLAYRLGGTIAGEMGWSAAVRETLDAPLPALAGTPQSCALRGLRPVTYYGLALRAIDDAGHLSPLSSVPLSGTTAEEQEPADTIPPAAIDDLALGESDETQLQLTWTAPGDDGAEGTAARFALAWIEGDESIDSEIEWEAAHIVSEGLPDPPVSGTAVVYWLTGLSPAQAYSIAVRAYDEVDLAGGLSNPLVATTLPLTPPADTIPPAPITDLSALHVGPESVELTWSSPGDDGTIGEAHHFILGWIADEPLDDDETWARAETLSAGLPSPGPPGTRVNHTLSALAPGRMYGAAVRACDEAGNCSELGSPIVFTTSDAADVTPPARVSDLTAAMSPTGVVLLAWTASGDDGMEGTAHSLVIARRVDQLIESESDWDAAWKETFANDIPGGAVDSRSLEGLNPDASWGFALRYRDDVGLLGEISNCATLVEPGDPGGADSTAPAPVRGLQVTELSYDAITICWSATGDDSTAGTASGYILASLEGMRVTSGNWAVARKDEIPALPRDQGGALCHTLDGLTAGASYGLAVCAFDDAGNVSALEDDVWVAALAPGPLLPPAPVGDLAATGAGADWIDLQWSAPSGSDGISPADRYEIGYQTQPFTEVEWEALVHAVPSAAPRSPGLPETLRLTSLADDDTYWVALRSRSAAGQWSALSNTVEMRTYPSDALAPQSPPAPHLQLSEDGAHVTVTWLSSAEVDVVGYNVYGRSADSAGRQQLNDAIIRETEWSFATPPHAGNFYVSVAAVDASGNLGVPGPEAALFADELLLEGPFPHPIEEDARFSLTLPPDPSGVMRVTARIFSVAGVLVRRWIDEALPAGPELSLRWDTRSDAGARVAPGLYFLKVEAAGSAILRKIYVRR